MPHRSGVQSTGRWAFWRRALDTGAPSATIMATRQGALASRLVGQMDFAKIPSLVALYSGLSALQYIGIFKVNNMTIEEQIKAKITSNPIVLFMKGSPDAPQCGFSMQTVQALKRYTNDFTYVDVLAEPEVRTHLPRLSNWPTFPQLFVDGELVGGCDITLELLETGELQKLIEAKQTTKSS